MKTIDRLLIKAKKLKMQIKRIAPVIVSNQDQIMDIALGYDQRYGKERWSTVFIVDDLPEDDPDCGVKIEHISEKYKGGVTDGKGKKKNTKT